MAKFIAVMGGKGGVGKTTHAINLGMAILKEGGDVIVIEGNFDSPSLGINLGVNYSPVTINDLILDDSVLLKAIFEHESGLKIIPADLACAHKEIDYDSLFRNLQELHLHADYVIVDGSSGLSHNTKQLFRLCDEVFIVSGPDNASVLEAKRLIDLAKKLKKPITGLVINKYKKSKYLIPKEKIQDFLGLPALSVIPEDFRFFKALHNKKPYVYMFPKKKTSKKYVELAKRLLIKP